MISPSHAIIPSATYRLQFNRDFTFADAEALVPYLAGLGITHAYASPLFAARAGSRHGYDVVDYNRLNPELGTREQFDRLIAALHRHEMGLVLDIVPNHMGVGGSENAWWLDVLEWGASSVHASWFDIDRRAFEEKLLVPFLGDRLEAILARGELPLRFERERGSLHFRYHEHVFPLAPRSYAAVFDVLRAYVGTDPSCVENVRLLRYHAESMHEGGGDARTRVDLARERIVRLAEDPAIAEMIANGLDAARENTEATARLLALQHYRLAWWRVAAEEGNYRRFFDVDALVAMRMESAACFEATHGLLFALIESGAVQGVRVDHADGLFDPQGYCERLRERVRAMGRDAYVVVEKILAGHERLNARWPVSGTTGYEFCALANGIFVDAASENSFDQAYRAFTGGGELYHETIHACKKIVMDASFVGGLNGLASSLHRIARSHISSCDYTQGNIRAALREIVAAFPTYRTYASARGVSATDRRDIEWAVALARKRSAIKDAALFAFIASVLTTDAARLESPRYDRREVIRFAMTFAQYTGPVAAKGVEDTAFYRYGRLLSLNEVGGDPGRFGVSVGAFHQAMRDRAKHVPHSLSASSTHDAKRGEDARARINVLSEMPARWSRELARFARLNRRHKREIGATFAPDAADEYFFYQALLGGWPPELGSEHLGTEAGSAYERRLEAYLIKALREAKRRSSWTDPDHAYEDATIAFTRGIFARGGDTPFWKAFFALLEPIARIGMLNGLGQTLLKITAPGIPDFYQGTELWELTFGDPDNRGTIDFARRRAMLEETPFPMRREHARALLENWKDGRVKLALTRAALAVRRERREAFSRTGGYAALRVVGTHAERVVAFERGGCVTVVPRLIAPLVCEESPFPLGECVWEQTALLLPKRLRGVQVHHAFTGERISLCESIPLAEILRDFPVALLVSDVGVAFSAS